MPIVLCTLLVFCALPKLVSNNNSNDPKCGALCVTARARIFRKVQFTFREIDQSIDDRRSTSVGFENQIQSPMRMSRETLRPMIIVGKTAIRANGEASTALPPKLEIYFGGKTYCARNHKSWTCCNVRVVCGADK